MREILFRGKTNKGEWVRGDLSQHKGGKKFIKCGSATSSYEIIPKTIGQYTEMCDKNGKMIFEGDIVKGLFRFYRPVNSVVAYSEGSFGLLWDRGGVETFWAFPTICNVEYEVIGNIHDHPELLKGGEG